MKHSIKKIGIFGLALCTLTTTFFSAQAMFSKQAFSEETAQAMLSNGLYKQVSSAFREALQSTHDKEKQTATDFVSHSIHPVCISEDVWRMVDTSRKGAALDKETRCRAQKRMIEFLTVLAGDIAYCLTEKVKAGPLSLLATYADVCGCFGHWNYQYIDQSTTLAYDSVYTLLDQDLINLEKKPQLLPFYVEELTCVGPWSKWVPLGYPKGVYFTDMVGGLKSSNTLRNLGKYYNIKGLARIEFLKAIKTKKSLKEVLETSLLLLIGNTLQVYAPLALQELIEQANSDVSVALKQMVQEAAQQVQDPTLEETTAALEKFGLGTGKAAPAKSSKDHQAQTAGLPAQVPAPAPQASPSPAPVPASQPASPSPAPAPAQGPVAMQVVQQDSQAGEASGPAADGDHAQSVVTGDTPALDDSGQAGLDAQADGKKKTQQAS
jgi:hypothetical protein